MECFLPKSLLVAFSTVNRDRARIWHQTQNEKWSLADWGNALAGETGELCNVIKKIRRIQTNTHQRYDETNLPTLIAKAREEIADVFIYLDLVHEQFEQIATDTHKPFTIIQTTANKFNVTSDQFGFPHKVHVAG